METVPLKEGELSRFRDQAAYSQQIRHDDNKTITTQAERMKAHRPSGEHNATITFSAIHILG